MSIERRRATQVGRLVAAGRRCRVGEVPHSKGPGGARGTRRRCLARPLAHPLLPAPSRRRRYFQRSRAPFPPGAPSHHAEGARRLEGRGGDATTCVRRRRQVGGHARRHGWLLRGRGGRTGPPPLPGCSASWSAREPPSAWVARASCSSPRWQRSSAPPSRSGTTRTSATWGPSIGPGHRTAWRLRRGRGPGGLRAGEAPDGSCLPLPDSEPARGDTPGPTQP